MGEGGGVEVGELTNLDDRFDEWLTDRLVGGGARPLEAAARGGRS